MTGCIHRSVEEFKDGDGLWICSVCKRHGRWGDGWRHYSSLGCRKCHREPAVEFVVCSKKCSLNAVTAKPKPSRSQVKIDPAAEIERIDMEIERLTKRRKKLERST